MRFAWVFLLMCLASCTAAGEQGLSGKWSAVPRATIVYDGFGHRYDAVTVDLSGGPRFADERFASMTPLLVRAESGTRYVVLEPHEVPAGPVQIQGKLIPQRLVFNRPSGDTASRTLARQEMLRNGQPVYEYVLIVGKLEPAAATAK